MLVIAETRPGSTPRDLWESDIMTTLLLVYLTVSLFVTIALVSAAILSGRTGVGEPERNVNEIRGDYTPNAVSAANYRGAVAYSMEATYQSANLSVNCLQEKEAIVRDADAIYSELRVWRTSNPEGRFGDIGAQMAPRRSRQLAEMLK